MNKEKKTFIVTGLPRGGTSIVAAILYKFGIYIRNSNGRFDDAGGINGSLPKVDKDFAIKYPHIKKDKYKKLIEKAENPHSIFVFRDLFAVSRESFYSMIDKNIDKTINLVENYKQCNHPTLVMSYEKLLVKKEKTIRELARFCGVELTKELLEECQELINPEDNYERIGKLNGS